MINNKKIIGLDVGGTHVTAGLIDTGDMISKPLHLIRKNFSSDAMAHDIIANIGECIKQIEQLAGAVEAVGIAFPGPCIYEKGVIALANVGGKFEQAFGLNMEQALMDFSGLPTIPFQFSNDADCFAVGARHKCGLNGKRTILLTLGTGFGSAFMADGCLVNSHTGIPASGMFFNQDFNGSAADEYFSTRWFSNEYKSVTGKEISSVKSLLASDADTAALLLNSLG